MIGGEEECGLRCGRVGGDVLMRCLFVMKQMSEKFVDKNKSLYMLHIWTYRRRMTWLIERQCGVSWVCME